jgi:anti-sigma regulatory factor (Ser/Thr protein kinase)
MGHTDDHADDVRRPGRAVTQPITRELPAVDLSPARARSIVREALSVWDSDDHVRLTELLTSELVTNAVRHAATEIMLSVEVDARIVRVEVTDTGADMPVVAATPDVGGYGLRIVDQLAARWGVDSNPNDGKTVWFEVELKEPEGETRANT